MAQWLIMVPTNNPPVPGQPSVQSCHEFFTTSPASSIYIKEMQGSVRRELIFFWEKKLPKMLKLGCKVYLCSTPGHVVLWLLCGALVVGDSFVLEGEDAVRTAHSLALWNRFTLTLRSIAVILFTVQNIRHSPHCRKQRRLSEQVPATLKGPPHLWKII